MVESDRKFGLGFANFPASYQRGTTAWAFRLATDQRRNPMIENASRLDTLDFFGLRVLEVLGFDPTVSRRYPLEMVVEATVGIVEVLDVNDISAIMVAGGIPTADVYATHAWTTWLPGTVGHHTAALAVITHLSEMTV
jgi:hypothetical protein